MLPFRTAAEREVALPVVVDALRDGGVIAYPTETVYGLGTTLNAAALATLARAKQRGRSPFLLLASDPVSLTGLSWSDAARRLAAAFWPGPLTLVLAAPPGVWPSEVSGPGGAVAVRSSPHPGVRALVDAIGGPITSTSANAAGEPPALSGTEAAAVAARLGLTDAIVLDGGPLDASAPSTIVDCTGARPRILRKGAVAVERLRDVLEEIDV